MRKGMRKKSPEAKLLETVDDGAKNPYFQLKASPETDVGQTIQKMNSFNGKKKGKRCFTSLIKIKSSNISPKTEQSFLIPKVGANGRISP